MLDTLDNVEKEGKKFYIQNHRLLLTYKTHINKEAYINWFGRNPKFIRLAHETGDKRHEYDHTHILIDFGKLFKSSNARIFDYKPDDGEPTIHPHVQLVKTKTHWERCLQYIAKEDPANKDLKVEGITSKVSRCHTMKEAFERYVAEPSDALGVSKIYNVMRTDPSKFSVTIPEKKFKPWQKKFLKMIEKKSSRTVNWIYDPVGNSGKTVWSHHMEDNYDEGWAIFNSVGRISDFIMNVRDWLNNGWNGTGMIFDFARDMDRNVVYTALEIAVDGRGTATKYEGGRIKFGKPIIFVFSNFVPNTERMSKDRWNVMKMTSKYDLKKLSLKEVESIRQKEEDGREDVHSDREDMSSLGSNSKEGDSDSEDESDEEK